MLETWEPGKIAMWVSWAALVLTGYLALAGVRAAGLWLMLAAAGALAAIAAGIAVERGYRVGDGIAVALGLGLLVGAARARNRAPARDDEGRAP